MKKSIVLIVSVFRSFIFNLMYVGIKQAFKLPVCISYNTKVNIRGHICIDSPLKFAMIRIGFHEADVSNPHDTTVLKIEPKGCLIFRGTAHIGKGSKIFVKENAVLEIGNNFAISASSQIGCYKYISFGNDIQFSWDCLVMDSDTHYILDENNSLINEDKKIIMGDKIWIGCRTTILKGSIIPNNCVIGAGSIVSSSCSYSPNTIIAGIPARSIKTIGSWKL